MTQLQLIKDRKREFEDLKTFVSSLLTTKHYKDMGSENCFAIVMKAKSMGIDPFEALNGGLYCVRGKIEMSSQMMNAQIRKSGHSIMKDPKSDDTICILHGRRADNGDTWTESFSMEDAKRAGLLDVKAGRGPGPWQSHPRAMLFARALSLLARQLFPDVIKNCYVEGEIQAVYNEPKVEPATETIDAISTIDLPDYIDSEQVDYLKSQLSADTGYEQTLLNFFKITDWDQLPQEQYDRVIKAVDKHFEARAV